MLNLSFKGFGDSPEALYYLDEIAKIKERYELEDFVDSTRQLDRAGDTIFYSLPGLPLCWKCTIKHLGQALGFAAEVEAYPERIACVVGELGHAYRECPDPEVAKSLRLLYTRILENGCIPDFTDVLKTAVKGWKASLAGDAR